MAMASGSKNTRPGEAPPTEGEVIHRCARINHHGSVILFDGPLGLWILNGSFACQDRETTIFIPVKRRVLKPKVAHSPVNPRRAESPITFIAQGKRSDTLGKPPHNITPRPARAKVNLNGCFSALLPLQGASYTAPLYPGCRFACPGLWRSLGFQPATLPIQSLIIRRTHSTFNIPHLTLNTQHSTLNIQHSTLNIINPSPPAKKSVAIRCAGGASKPSSGQRSKSKESVKRPIRAHPCYPCFFDKSNPNGICVDMCDPWENKYRFIRHFARLEALWASWNVKICHSCSMLMKKNITLQRKVLR